MALGIVCGRAAENLGQAGRVVTEPNDVVS